MSSAPADASEGDGEALQELGSSRPRRRLRLTAVLLVATAVLGLAVATAIVATPPGEGLGSLLKEAKADILGQVKEPDGSPVEGATVVCVDTDQSDTTGVGGWYFLEDVPTGRVELRMTAEGYVSVRTKVHLERGEHMVDIVTEPGTGTRDVDGEALPGTGDPGSGRGMMAMAIAAVSVLLLAGAVCAYFQRYYVVVITAALLGILTWGWYIGSGLSILSLLLVLPLREHFRDHAEGTSHPWSAPPPPSLEEDVGTPGDAGGGTTGEDVHEVTPHREGDDLGRRKGGLPPGG